MGKNQAETFRQMQRGAVINYAANSQQMAPQVAYAPQPAPSTAPPSYREIEDDPPKYTMSNPATIPPAQPQTQYWNPAFDQSSRPTRKY